MYVYITARKEYDCKQAPSFDSSSRHRKQNETNEQQKSRWKYFRTTIVGESFPPAIASVVVVSFGCDRKWFKYMPEHFNAIPGVCIGTEEQGRGEGEGGESTRLQKVQTCALRLGLGLGEVVRGLG
jgi:hypothetical protein